MPDVLEYTEDGENWYPVPTTTFEISNDPDETTIARKATVASSTS